MYATVNEHTRELKNRLLILFSVALIVFLFCFPLASTIVSDFIPKGVEVIYTSPTDALYVEALICLLLTIILIFPVFIYHITKFIEPNKRVNPHIFLRLLFPSILYGFGFILGAKYFTPLILTKLLVTSYATPMMELTNILWFTTTVGLCMGAVTTMPYIVWKFKIPSQLLRQYRRHIILVTLLVTGILSADPTIFTQLILSIPFIISYEISILLSVKHKDLI